ncbi:MAG: hypothetical protein BWY89_00240 [Bacteroidetes bacterium ADurb.BinA012]|nr:MAG: hypothetical protein BWY89_00240 [Bacteroidetes bacterium ADurb.BinA012]
MPEILVLVGKFRRYGEFRHYGLAVEIIIFNLVSQFHSVADRLWHIGKDAEHLFCALQILLFGISKPFRVIEVLACIEADETVMGLGVILHYEVDVIRSNYFNIMFCSKFTVCSYHPLLLRKDGDVCCRVSCFMALHFKIVIVAENLPV